MEWALIDGKRRKAEQSGQLGACPGCGGEVRAKCGEIVSWHWAHVNADCDSWSEPETDWHRKWKGFFPDHWQEVTKPPHRADVAGPDGVLEIQRSGISPEEIREREQFYGRMAWLLNGHDFWENFEWIKTVDSYHEFRWKHARKTWITAGRTIFIDTPLGLFRVKNIRDGKWKVVCGFFVKAASLAQKLDSSGKTKASMELLLYDSFAQEKRQDLFDQSNMIIDLYREYAVRAKQAWPDSSVCEYRMWREYRSIYDCLLRANPKFIQAIIEHYKARTKEAQEKIAADEAIKRKQEKELEKMRRRAETEEALRKYAVVGAAPIQNLSEGKRLPGKIDWSKINIPQPAWD
jgi:competence protein CoiA